MIDPVTLTDEEIAYLTYATEQHNPSEASHYQQESGAMMI
jgi:hypothetical protein